MYQCEHCKYESMYKYNVDRHVVAKHKLKTETFLFFCFLKTETYQAHRNYASHPHPYVKQAGNNTRVSTTYASDPHPYVHPYLTNAHQQPNT